MFEYIKPRHLPLLKSLKSMEKPSEIYMFTNTNLPYGICVLLKHLGFDLETRNFYIGRKFVDTGRAKIIKRLVTSGRIKESSNIFHSSIGFYFNYNNPDFRCLNFTSSCTIYEASNFLKDTMGLTVYIKKNNPSNSKNSGIPPWALIERGKFYLKGDPEGSLKLPSYTAKMDAFEESMITYFFYKKFNIEPPVVIKNKNKILRMLQLDVSPNLIAEVLNSGESLEVQNLKLV